MKEKKILIAVLLSMTFQAEAGRSVFQKPEADDVADDMQASKEEAKAEKEANRKKKQAEEKKNKQKSKEKKEAPTSTVKRGYRKEGLEKTEEQLAPLTVKAEGKRQAVREKREQKKEGLYTKNDRNKEAKDKKEVVKKETVEARYDKEIREEEQQEARREKKRSTLEKSAQKLEQKLKDLEKQKAAALRKIEEEKVENGDKEATKSHIVNHEPVKTEPLEQDIVDIKGMLGRKEEAIEAVSKDIRAEKEEEYRNRTALNLIYENNQKELRKDLKAVEDEIHVLRGEQVVAKNAIHDDRDSYEEHLKNLRNAETRKDSVAAADYKEALLAVHESKEMKALHARQKRINDDLNALRRKMNVNDTACKNAAKDAGIVMKLKKEKAEKKLDKRIREGNEVRPYSSEPERIKKRQEDREYKGLDKIEPKVKAVKPKKVSQHEAGSKEPKDEVKAKRAASKVEEEPEEIKGLVRNRKNRQKTTDVKSADKGTSKRKKRPMNDVDSVMSSMEEEDAAA